MNGYTKGAFGFAAFFVVGGTGLGVIEWVTYIESVTKQQIKALHTVADQYQTDGCPSTETKPYCQTTSFQPSGVFGILHEDHLYCGELTRDHASVYAFGSVIESHQQNWRNAIRDFVRGGPDFRVDIISLKVTKTPHVPDACHARRSLLPYITSISPP